MSLIEGTKKVNAIMIIEVLGKPPEHLKEILENMIKKIDEEKGVQVKNKKINEPKELEKKQGFYTNFAEVEVEVEEILYLAMLMFKYMPSHIDVISPEYITLKNNVWGEILSELVRKLHGYDELARIIQLEKIALENKLKTLEKTKNKPGEIIEEKTNEKEQEDESKKKDKSKEKTN